MKSKINWRVFISFGLTWSFLIIAVSGIILYMSPAGRYANWVNWKIAGINKEGWQNIHTVFSFAFVILSVFHLTSINWKTFWSYIRSKTASGINKKKEMAISLAFTLLFFLGVLFSTPPFSFVSEFGEYLGTSWENQEQASPIAHAELLTISELAKELNYTNDSSFVKNLRKNGLLFKNPEKQSLKEIAEANNKTPEEIYKLITKEGAAERPGAGMGKKTIETLANELGKPVDEILLILKSNNIAADKNHTIKQVADDNNTSPKEIFDLLKNQ